MESNNELKEIKNHMCYYFDSIIKIEEFDFNNNLKGKSSYENIFIYNISYTTLIGAKPFRIRFHKVNRLIRIYMGAIYLVLFRPEKYNAIYNRIVCLISPKGGIAYVIFHNYAIKKIDSWFFASRKNNYCYNIFLE